VRAKTGAFRAGAPLSHHRRGTTPVSDLDIGTLAQDSVSRGYLSRSCYRIGVETGFELWRCGAGLKTSSFSVHISGGGRKRRFRQL
jgi:hypothetical protein